MSVIRAPWVAAHAALFLLALNLFDILLRKRYAETPSLLAGWLLAAFVLVLVVRGLATRADEPDMKLVRFWRRLDAPGLALLAFCLGLVFFFHDGYVRAASDGREYFVQVRSLIMDWDLDFRNENATFGVRGTAERYASGAAVLWAPFFVACHWWLGLLGLVGVQIARDGYANPYQMAVGLGTLVYGCTGLALVYRIVREYVTDWVAVTATICVCAGSFLIWYLTVENSMVHGASMFSTTLFVFVWHRSRHVRSVPQWALLGAAAGLMTMVRWQNALFVVFPIADAVRDYSTAWAGRAPALARVVRNHATFVVSGFIAFLPQLWFWQRVRGHWLNAPAGAHGVSWLETEIGQVLFSPHHGLFSTSPLLYVSVAGLVLFLFGRSDRRFAGLLTVVFLGPLYVNSTVENWWGGAGFGARRFSNCTLVFAVGLAVFLSWAIRRPRVVLGSVLAAVVAVNVFVMTDVRRGVLPADAPITFDRVFASFYERVGNPFSFPMNAFFVKKYEGSYTLYDRLGTRTFNFRLDVGSGDDESFLVRGWSEAEQSGGFTFCWSEGPESSLLVPLRESAEYRLLVRCEPFRYPGSGRQVMQVIANGGVRREPLTN